MKNVFKRKHVLITGGLGFIGSNLAQMLVRLGAKVTVLDNLSPNQGGNLFNVAPIKSRITIRIGDIRDEMLVKELIIGKDFIFHLARQTDHILSLTNPYPDIDVNIRGTTILLEACKYNNPTVKFIYIGTRGQYGPAVSLPVAEDAPTHPKGIYEITNLAAEKIIEIYHNVHHIPSIMLRLTNTYGPRAQMHHDRYGIVNWFVRLAMDNESIPIFGDGLLKRDFLYVDDAVDAIIAAASLVKCYGEIFNVGDPRAETLTTLVNAICKAAKKGTHRFTPYTQERAAQEPGDFASDITKIKKFTGWKPKTKLATGLAKTIAYYKKYKKYYW